MTSKRTDPYWQAQDILSRRDHSETEVRQKMGRQGFSSLEIERAIEQLYVNKLLNDHQFARRYVENLLERKLIGPRYLAAKLKQRGIAPDIIAAAIERGFTGDRSEESCLARAADQWKRSHRQHEHDRERLQRFLLSRGFSLDVIYSYLQKDLE